MKVKAFIKFLFNKLNFAQKLSLFGRRLKVITFFLEITRFFALKMLTIKKDTFLKNWGWQNLLLQEVPVQKAQFLPPSANKTPAPLLWFNLIITEFIIQMLFVVVQIFLLKKNHSKQKKCTKVAKVFIHHTRFFKLLLTLLKITESSRLYENVKCIL